MDCQEKVISRVLPFGSAIAIEYNLNQFITADKKTFKQVFCLLTFVTKLFYFKYKNSS